MATRLLRRLSLALFGVLLGLAGGELGLRALLFSELPAALDPLTDRLRDPKLLASPYEGEVQWMLRHLFGDAASDRAPGAHPDFGWVNRRFDPQDLEHRLEAQLNGRRAFLLFGDSFTKCLTSRVDCFQGLAADLPLADDALVLNYGVGGYGFDQIQLVADETLKRWDHLLALDPDRLRPVVAVAIYIEDDLDRATMSVRGWVKPYYRVTDEGLALQLPETSSTLAHIARKGTGVRSWLLRLAVYGHGLFPSLRAADASAHEQRLRAVTRALLARLKADLEARDLEHFFVILPGQPAIWRGGWNWREPLLEQLLVDQGSRFVNARPDFEADMQAHGREPDAYFGQGSPLFGHYNRLGNSVAMITLLRGLAGQDDGGAPIAEATLADPALRSISVQLERNAPD